MMPSDFLEDMIWSCKDLYAGVIVFVRYDQTLLGKKAINHVMVGNNLTDLGLLFWFEGGGVVSLRGKGNNYS
jgi:hypothetical protein